MEVLIELVLDLILEGSLEISSNKKVSKVIRYPLIILILLFFATVIIGMFMIGINIINKNIFAGILVIAVSLILLVGCILKFRELYFSKKRNKE